jgi:flagellin-like protein
MRKGVSPVVATVLLVAVAVSIGIATTTWVTHWVATETQSTGMDCSLRTAYDIDSAIFNQTGDDYLFVKITNKGEEDIYGFGAVLDNGTIILRINTTDDMMIDQGNVTLELPLERQESAYLKINLTNTTAGHGELGSTLTEITIRNTVCEAVSQKTTTITKY